MIRRIIPRNRRATDVICNLAVICLKDISIWKVNLRRYENYMCKGDWLLVMKLPPLVVALMREVPEFVSRRNDEEEDKCVICSRNESLLFFGS